MDRLDYLGYLARTVPPQRLAQVVALRLWRNARRSFNGALAPPSAEEVLTAFEARTPASLGRRLAAPIPGAFGFGSPASVAAAAEALTTRLPAERERAIELGREALARRSCVFGRIVELAVAEREVPHASPGWKAIDWERDPIQGVRDPKYPWLVGRLDEVVHLACAAALTRSSDREASQAFVDAAIDRAVDFASAPRGVQWTCPMEAALRAANLAMALRILGGHPALDTRGPAVLEVLRSIAFHMRWVETHLEDTVAVPNNHLVSNLVGIAVVGALLPRLPGVVGSGRIAAERIGRELLAQTLPDGLSFEASVPYHRLAVELFLLGDLAAESLGVPLPSEARTRLASMFAATRELIDGRGLAPQIGDNDSGRALPFRVRHPQDQAWLLPLGAARFEREDLHLGEPGPEAVWLLGLAGLQRLARLRKGRAPRDSALHHGGIYLLRSDRISCAIACGPNGTGGTGSHGHNDKLSIEVCVDGHLVIGDPGSGSYTGDPELRNRLRSTGAHSTVVLDGAEQQELPAERLFALPDQAHATCLAFETGRERSRFLGVHHGYERLLPQASHRREVVLDRAGEDGPTALFVTDEIGGGSAALAEVRFLVCCGGARVRALTAEERARVEAASRRFAGARELPWDADHAVELGPAGAPLALLLAAGATGAASIEDAVYARGYGELEHALVACFPLAGSLPMVVTTLLLPMGDQGRVGSLANG